MVVSKSQERNNKAIREMVGNRKFIGDGKYIVTDAIHNEILVDTKTGMVCRYMDGEIIGCNTAETSKKQNGYLYVKIVIDLGNDYVKYIDYAQHSLVAMVAHTDEYDELVESGVKKPIVNHKNNCPWDNSSENLEWTTYRFNILHAKLVHGINSSVYSQKYIEIMHNQSEVDFICLKQGISVKLIEEYERYIKIKGHESLNEFWGFNDKIRKTDVISNTDIMSFIGWIDKYNI